MFCDISQSHSKMGRKPFPDLERYSQVPSSEKSLEPLIGSANMSRQGHITKTNVFTSLSDDKIPTECVSILKYAST